MGVAYHLTFSNEAIFFIGFFVQLEPHARFWRMENSSSLWLGVIRLRRVYSARFSSSKEVKMEIFLFRERDFVFFTHFSLI